MMVPRVGAVAAILLTWTGRAWAQDATGHIEGRVLAADAAPAGSVRVTASGPSLQLSRMAETDVRGYFHLQDLPVGTFQVRLAVVGYRPVRFDSVAVRLGRTTSLGETRLEPQAFELDEIVVNAQRPLVDMASAATVTNLPSEQFRDLPTERDFRSIVSLAPQANDLDIAGSSWPENAYYLDGVNITEPRLAATSADLPYNFVREIQVKAGGWEAEYGRSTGGIIDVITHSGGNRFGGQVFGYLTNNGLTAEPRFAVEGVQQSQFSDYDVGGSLGGPILRDRLWFFASYNPSFHQEQLAVSVRGPKIPDEQRTEHLFATKLTWRAGPSTDVVVTAHGDPSRSHGFELGSAVDSLADLDAVTFVHHGGGLVLSTLVRQRLGAAVQAELGVARFTRDDATEDASGRTDPFFRDLTTGVVSGGFGQRYSSNSVRSGARGSVAAALGRHAVKMGVEYEDNHIDDEFDASAEPGSPQGFIHREDSTTYTWYRQRSGGVVHNQVLTAYGQDSWRLGDRLMLSYGLRWDAEYLIRPDGKLAQRFTDQWQPRVGFTYQIGTPGSQKVFGSYGRFYEQFPLQLALSYYSIPAHTLILQYDHDPRVDPSGADTLFDSSSLVNSFLPQRDLRGQSLDEFTLGYERALGGQFRVGVRGVYRTLHWAVEDAVNPATGEFEIGNPGRGNLEFAQRARRTYHALVLTFENPQGRRFSFLASYVLSRSWGNYGGLVADGNPSPNITPTFDLPETDRNITGRSGRPHVFKFSGSYRFDFGLSIGTAIAWMSGNPRNEFGMVLTPFGEGVALLQPLGSVGRTDAVFDASLRFTYVMRPWGNAGVRPKVYLDLFRLGNRRTALDFQELHYFGVDSDGNPTTPNPDYGKPDAFQPPMSARIGLSLDFGVLE